MANGNNCWFCHKPVTDWDIETGNGRGFMSFLKRWYYMHKTCEQTHTNHFIQWTEMCTNDIKST